VDRTDRAKFIQPDHYRQGKESVLNSCINKFSTPDSNLLHQFLCKQKSPFWGFFVICSVKESFLELEEGFLIDIRVIVDGNIQLLQ